MEIEKIKSIVESLLFASDKPLSFAALKSVFHGSGVDSDTLQDSLNKLSSEYNGGDRGVVLEEVGGGYQLRTKSENAEWIKKLIKTRPFRLSGPALEVLSIVAYKQPVIKAELDQIRGVECSHLLRALMEKNLVKFAGKSELPGKPMLYATTKEFLEIFGLRNIRELPTLNEIDELLPEGMGVDTDLDLQEKETLTSLSEKIGLPSGKSYSESEEELLSITDELSTINTTTDFFEQEKLRQKAQKENDKAQDIRERLVVGEFVDETEKKWLERFERKLNELAQVSVEAPKSPALTESKDSDVQSTETVLEEITTPPPEPYV